MTASPAVHQMLFSTRGRDPAGGADSVREVIARSPGVSERAQREFAARADLGGSLLHAELDGPVYTFSPVDDGTWLLCRAVSLGRYRKGAHQLLVHGLLLSREHLAWLDGNPLLLGRPDLAEAAGLRWTEEHPGERAEVPALALDPAIARRAPAANRQRLGELAQTESADDPAFPAAFGALARGERVACVTERPRASWVEWLLLHLHPLDRPEVGFHTWYSHGRPMSYRLLVTTPREAPRVRGQFSGLRLVDLGEAAADPVGEAARRLRARSPEEYQAALAACHLTRLADRGLPPLGEADALLGLRDAAGEELTGEERARADLLRQRSEPAGRLRYAIGDLAAAWRAGSPAPDFAAAVRRMVAAVDVEPAAVDAVAGPIGRLPAEDAAERWALLALLHAAADRRPGLEDRRVPAWRAVAPRGRLDELLGTVEGRAAEAVETLDAYVSPAAEADATGGGGEIPDWPAYLAWRGRLGLVPGPVARRVEELAAGMAPAAGAAWLRRLGEVHAAAGLPGEALRIWFDDEAPRLSDADRQSRVDEVVAWALEHGVAGLEERLDHPDLGDAVPSALAAWAAGRPDPDAAWAELSALLRAWRIGPAGAAGCGALIAGLAASPLAPRVPRAVEILVQGIGDRPAFVARLLAEAAGRLASAAEAASEPGEIRDLVAGTSELLQVRGRHVAAAAADPALLRLTLAAVVLDEAAPAPGPAGGGRFRAAWTSFLGSELVRRDAPGRLAGDLADDWMDLLADDLRRDPPAGATDPRHVVYLELAWRRWAAERATVARLRLRRALGLRPAGADAAWHREIVAGAVPAALRPEAEGIAAWTGRAAHEPIGAPG